MSCLISILNRSSFDSSLPLMEEELLLLDSWGSYLGVGGGLYFLLLFFFWMSCLLLGGLTGLGYYFLMRFCELVCVLGCGSGERSCLPLDLALMILVFLGFMVNNYCGLCLSNKI